MNATERIHTNQHLRSPRSQRRRAGFSITEMLVVVGIIVLLASLLMVAMGRVRDSAMQSQSLSIMQNFAAACDAFQTDHGIYPGVIPERVLALEDATIAGGDVISFTSTENALLHMMGGYRVLPPGVPENNDSPLFVDYNDYVEDYELEFGSGPNQWRLKIKLSDIGQGPVINGKPYASYYTPGSNEVAVAPGQLLTTDITMDPADWIRIPDLIDAWGQPILYMRQSRTTGPLVGDPDTIAADGNPQFFFGDDGVAHRRFGGMSGYVSSTSLGEFGMDQVTEQEGSILNAASVDRIATFAQIIRNPAFGAPDQPLDAQRAAARGAYVLISAGADGIFFSALDGPGTSGDPVSNIVNHVDHGNPRVVETYDDVMFFGGG